MALTFIGDLIGGLITAGVNAAIGKGEQEDAQAFAAQENSRNREFAAEQASIDRKENFRYGEMAADNADARSRALYQSLQSPQAMLNQLRQAGLSPSMMFGGGGASGASVPNGAQGNGAQGIQTPYSYSNTSPLEAAQIAATRAQTNFINAQTQEKLGLTISSLLDMAKTAAETGNKEASSALMLAQEAQTKLQSFILENTAEFTIEKAAAEAEIYRNNVQKGMWDIISAQSNALVDTETMKSRIELAASQVKLTNAQALLTKANTNLSNAEREKINAEINKWETELAYQWQEISIKLIQAGTQQEYNEILQNYYNKQNEILEKQVGLKSKELRHTIINDHIGNALQAIQVAVKAAKQ